MRLPPTRSILLLLIGSLVVSCGDLAEPSDGTLLITIQTTGARPDPDGYTIQLDTESAQPIGVNATLDRPGLPAGSHLVLLGGVAGNCTIAGANPWRINIPARDTSTVVFQVSCNENTGTIRVTTATTGFDQDEGYLVSIEGMSDRAIGRTTTLNILASAGAREVRLTGVAPNCTVQGENPRQVTVNQQSIVDLAFSVDCAVVRAARILFLSQQEGVQGIYTVRPDGTELRGLATGESQYKASWSPDGSKIAFSSYTELERGRVSVMNVDGSGRTVLSRDGWALPPAWSPDGRTIAFIDEGDDRTRIDPQIYLIGTDGLGRRQLTRGKANVTHPPRWSPDGSRILFGRGYDRILTITADGTLEDTLTAPPPSSFDSDPQWSPDGTRIAFIRTTVDTWGEISVSNLWVMNADGSNSVAVTHFTIDGPDSVYRFSWAGDGNGLVITSGYRGIFRIQPDGSGLTKLFDPIVQELVWSPDGSRMVFGRLLDGQTDLFVMNAEGGGLTNITQQPGYDGEPSWQP